MHAVILDALRALARQAYSFIVNARLPTVASVLPRLSNAATVTDNRHWLLPPRAATVIAVSQHDRLTPPVAYGVANSYKQSHRALHQPASLSTSTENPIPAATAPTITPSQNVTGTARPLPEWHGLSPRRPDRAVTRRR